MSKNCEFTRYPGSVFVTPILPSSVEVLITTPDWGHAAQVAAKALVASDIPITPATVSHQSVQPQDTPLEPLTSDPRKEFVPGAAENMRVYQISHLGEKDKRVYEASPSEDEDDIFQRAQQFADSTGYLVRIVRHNPHLIKSFRPAVWRENPNAPPIVDPEVSPPSEKLEGLGFYGHVGDSAMFFDDRPLQNGRWKRRERSNVIAWLNSSRSGHFDLNIVRKDLLCLLKPIPRGVTSLGNAIDWVCYHAEWRDV